MTEINYRTQAAAQIEADAAQDQDEKNRAVFREALMKYSFASHIANYRILLDWCGAELTLNKIDHLLRTKPDGLSLDFQDEKPRLIDAILAARQYPNVEQERRRLQLLTRVQLLDRLAEMTTKEELSKFTAVQLRERLAEGRKSNVPRYAGFPNCPRMIVPEGFTTAVDAGEYFRHCALAKTPRDLFEFRKYVRFYGAEQVDDIRFGRI
jgi:hypothetical protein